MICTGTQFLMLSNLLFLCTILQTLLRVWDCLFYEGNKVLLRVGLSLIILHKDKLLECKNFPEVVTLFKNMTTGKSTLHCHQFMEVCLWPIKYRSWYLLPRNVVNFSYNVNCQTTSWHLNLLHTDFVRAISGVFKSIFSESLTLTVRGSTLVRRQILTTTVYPRTVKVKIFLMALDP